MPVWAASHPAGAPRLSLEVPAASARSSAPVRSAYAALLATDCQAARGVGQCTAGLDAAGQLPKRFGAARARCCEQCVLAGQQFPGAGEFEQDPGVGAEFGVPAAGEGAADGEGGVDHAVVDRVGRLGGGAAVGDVLAGRAQCFGGGDELAQADHDVRAVVAGVGDGVAFAHPQPPDGGVGASGLLVQGSGVGGGVGQEPDGGAPLGLELCDGGGDGGAYLGVGLLDATDPGHVLGGVDGREGPEGEERDDRHHQQRDDLRADGGGAQPQPGAGLARGARETRVGRVGLRRRRFLGRRPGVGPAAACRGRGQPRRRCFRFSAGCSHGLLVPGRCLRVRSCGGKSGGRRVLGGRACGQSCPG